MPDGSPPPRPRLRELGLRLGLLPPGPTNSLVDVDGVAVGHTTVWRDEPRGRGVARTGVTAIIPLGLRELLSTPLPAGVAVLNGAGELTGAAQIREWGRLETPILLTGTMAVGRVYDAAVAALVEAEPAVGDTRAVIPVVAECDDSRLSWSRVAQLQAADVHAALQSASRAPVAQGVVGAGTGMICHGFKGGIGSASRRVGGHTVGVLALTNYGLRERLTVAGRVVGPDLAASSTDGVEPGSCVVIAATDAACDAHQCERLARRTFLGLARTGSFGAHGSGELACAFSTSARLPPVGTAELDGLFAAVVEATEEAALDSLFVADTVVGRDGRTVMGLPVAELLGLLRP